MKNQSDPSHEATDKEILNIEREIAKEYELAHKEVTKKLNNYLERFAEKDEVWRKSVENGTKTEKDYIEWRKGQIIVGKRWENMCDALATDYTHVSQIAQSIAKKHAPEVYSNNYNYETYNIEHQSQIDTSFTLYSRETIERMYRDDPKLYHNYGKAVAKNIKEGKQHAWDKRRVKSVITQAVLQGESIPKIVKRLEAVTGGDHKAAVRNARTMMTGVENAGRIDAMDRAKQMGIPIQKQWLATLDNRTRHWHRELDGVTVDIDKPFENAIGKIMFPADPDADSANVYNCRCTLIASIKGFELDVRNPNVRPMPKLGDMTYEEWLDGKSKNLVHALDKKPSAPKVKSESYQDFTKALNSANVKYNRVEKHEKRLAEDEIIKRISGGDKTSGSCFSTACAYIGNKYGYDVLDFRGGTATKHFASGYVNIVKLQGISPTMVKGGLANAKKLLESVEEGKEYLFTGGRHTAIVRRYEGRLQYLELQHQSENGWTDFERTIKRPRVKALYLEQQGDIHVSVSDTLKNRFRAKGRMCEYNYLVDIGQFEGNDEFIDLLGYMNTSHDKQMKGTGGGIK